MKMVPIKKVVPGMTLAQDVFVYQDKNTAYLRRGAALDAVTIRRLREHGVEKVYVEGLYTAPTRQPIVFETHTPVSRSMAPLPQQLRHDAISSLENLFTGGAIQEGDIHQAAQLVSQLDTVVSQLVNALSSDHAALVNISDLKSYDDYTYHHSLSVAVLSIGVGQYLGLSARQLNSLGLCAMMHDIGKTAIPIEIIRKPSKLDDDEYNTIKSHSSLGTSYLMEANIGNETLWGAVLFHHERMDGKGYPRGLKGNTIPVFSRIISVADVYDALTSARPYRQPMQPSEAIEYIMGGCNTAFDYDIVTALMHKVDLYPAGSIVQLSDGRYALVLDNENQLRPIVELLDSHNVIDLFRDRGFLNVTITRAVPENELALHQKRA